MNKLLGGSNDKKEDQYKNKTPTTKNKYEKTSAEAVFKFWDVVYLAQENVGGACIWVLWMLIKDLIKDF